MRWDNLFDDLLGQLDRELATERADERRDVARSEIADIAFRQMLATLAQRKDRQVILRTVATHLVGRVDTVGADWVAFSTWGHEPQHALTAHVVPLAAVTALELSDLASVVRATCGVFLENGDERAAPALPDNAPERAGGQQKRPRLIDRITFATVLRDLARRRRWVNITTVDGTVGGTLDAVGRDWCELAQHPRDVARRQSAITGITLISLSAVCDVRVD
jgi:hypothetical protein